MLRAMLFLLLLACMGGAHAQAARAAGPSMAAQAQAAMALPEELRQALQARKPEPGMSAQERVQGLIDFMVADDGLALRYQEQPTFGIAESYAQRKVNCLSFTLMFIALARASGMRAHAQASDDALAMRVLGDTVYRATHVNAGIEIDGRRYTVDVGWRSLLAAREPRTITDVQAIALLHNNKAVEQLLLGAREQAAAEIETALLLDPANPAAWSNAGVLQWRSGRRADAEHAYLQALKLQRDHLGALSNLVVLHRESGAARQADGYAKRLQRAQAADPFSQFLIAEALEGSGSYDDAVAHYRRAIRLLPDEPQFHRRLADAYQKQGNASAAQRARSRAGVLEARRASQRGIRDAEGQGPG
jgi:tetratricopeptide (TPR) repeat protein